MAGIGEQIHEKVNYEKNDKTSLGQRHGRKAGKL